MIETLAADVRSRFQTKRVVKESQKGAVCDQPFDSVYIYYTWTEEGIINVTDVKQPPDDILISRAVQVAKEEARRGNVTDNAEENTGNVQENEDGNAEENVDCIDITENKSN